MTTRVERYMELQSRTRVMREQGLDTWSTHDDMDDLYGEMPDEELVDLEAAMAKWRAANGIVP